MGAVWGRKITVTIFGESHGAKIGCTLGNLPPGIALDLAEVRREMQRRAPGQSEFATSRKEADEFEIVSGLFGGKTTGSPLTMLITNTNQRSGDYNILQDVLRPGHADYTGKIKYKQCNDYRGGGHFSGRLTAPLVFAGAVAKQILAKYNICIASRIKSIANIHDSAVDNLTIDRDTLHKFAQDSFPVVDKNKAQEMQEAIRCAKEKCDSVGGRIECFAVGLPVGLGEPFFNSLESELAQMLFSVPAVKGLEFGDGFKLADMPASAANDQMRFNDNGRLEFLSNHNGGILGGITNSLPLVFNVAIKPTPSIAATQKSVNYTTKENIDLNIHGRHDPCIVIRALPVIEAACAIVLLDNMMLRVGEEYDA